MLEDRMTTQVTTKRRQDSNSVLYSCTTPAHKESRIIKHL